MPGLKIAGFGDGGLAMTSFILGSEAALTFAANVELRVADLDAVEAVRRDAVVFARPRRGGRCSAVGGGAERCCSGDVIETARLSSLPGSVATKPGGAASAMTGTGAVGGTHLGMTQIRHRTAGDTGCATMLAT